jgi:hypothetical protein
MEASMDTSAGTIVSVLVIVLGLALMVGGIITEKHGAVVIGLIVAAVSVQQLLKKNKLTDDERSGHAR